MPFLRKSTMLPRHPSGGDENWVLSISFENRSPLFGLRSIGGLAASLFEARICVIGGLEERFLLAMRLGVQPGIWWIGFGKKRSGSGVQVLQMNS